MVLADSLSVDVGLVAQIGAVIGPLVAAVLGYGSLRAQVGRNTERVEKVEQEMAQRLMATDSEIRSLREWRAREEGAARVEAQVRGDKSEPLTVSSEYHHRRKP